MYIATYTPSYTFHYGKCAHQHHIAPNYEPHLAVQNVENNSGLAHIFSLLIYFPRYKKMDNAYRNHHHILQQKNMNPSYHQCTIKSTHPLLSCI